MFITKEDIDNPETVQVYNGLPKMSSIEYMPLLWDSWYYGTSTLINMEVSSLGVNVLYFMRSVIW